MTQTPILADIQAAARAINAQLSPTKLLPAHISGLWLKDETRQPTGAFKIRGVTNALGHLPLGARGVITASTGNHGRALAYAARRAGLQAVIALSEQVPANKVDAIRELGAELLIRGSSQDAAMRAAQARARDGGLALIPPFDHPHIIAGQGTMGLELLEQRPGLEAVLVPLSGGGLAAGVALAIKSLAPKIRVIGVSMRRGAAMAASLAAGRPVEVAEEATLADSLGGGIGLENAYSFALCQRYLDDVILVEEPAIYAAIAAHFHHDTIVTEGAGAVGLAAILSGAFTPRGECATILSGQNIDLALHRAIIGGQGVRVGALDIDGANDGQ